MKPASEWKPDVEGVFLNLPSDRYHAAPGFSHSMSLHMDPPSRLPVYLTKREKPTQYMIMGTLAHAFALEPDKPLPFIAMKPEQYPAPADSSLVKSKKVTVGDMVDWNGNANYCKKWAADREAEGSVVVTQSELDELDGMVRALNYHPIVGPALANSLTEVSVFHAHSDGDDNVLRKCRIDIVPIGKNALLDVKTVDEASEYTSRSKLEYEGWDTQAANNTDLFNYQNPDDYRSEFGFVLIERKPPHVIYLCHVGQKYMERGRAKMAERIHAYAQCWKSGIWPGNTPQWNMIEPRERRYA